MIQWQYLVVEEYFDDLQETHFTSPNRVLDWSTKPKFRHAGFVGGDTLDFSLKDENISAIHQSNFTRTGSDDGNVNTYEMLDRLGKEGWELCTTYTMQGKYHEDDLLHIVVRHIFKRPFSGE